MGLTVKENGFIVPAGRHLAVCYGVVDLGTQPNRFEPGRTEKKVKLLFELSDLIIQFIEGAEKRPAAVSKEYTKSLSLSAELRQHLESWRGNKFTEIQLKGFDLYNIIGKPCMLEVYHKPQKNKGGFWVEIQRIYTAPKGSTPPQFNETIKFSFEEYSPESFLNLPEYLHKKVMQAEEYRDLPQELKPILESDSNEIDPEEVIF